MRSTTWHTNVRLLTLRFRRYSHLLEQLDGVSERRLFFFLWCRFLSNEYQETMVSLTRNLYYHFIILQLPLSQYTFPIIAADK